jgi:hypothetical protein
MYCAKVAAERLLAVRSLLANGMTDPKTGPFFPYRASGCECFEHAWTGTYP